MSGKRSKPEAGGRGRDMVWSSILTLTIVGVSQRANPQTPAPTALRVGPMIKLRIHNYGISRTLLLQSEGEATAILNHAGLAVGWVDVH